MIFTASRGKAFKESFEFKNEKGQAIAAPQGEFVLSLERGMGYVRTYTLKRERTKILWNMTAAETQDLEYSTLYFVLYHNGSELLRGVLRVQ